MKNSRVAIIMMIAGATAGLTYTIVSLDGNSIETQPTEWVGSHIITDNGTELHLSTIWQDEYSVSDMYVDTEMPSDCVKTLPVIQIEDNKNQDANELPSYVGIKQSIVIPENAVILSSKELDRTLHKLRQVGLPIVMSAIDYDLGVIAIWTPDLTIGDKFKAELGDVPFVLLYEEAPPRWETGDPGEQNEN